MVPALLKHLGIEHVSILCHSAGTPYAFNTLYTLRHLLDPAAPYIGIMGPWVHSDHSEKALLSWAAKLPNGVLDGWNGLAWFINTKVAPSVSWSGGAISSVTSLFRTSPTDAEPDEIDLAKLIGRSKEVAKELERLQGKFFFAEDTTAANEDARMCLKLGGEGLWGECEDYDDFVQKVVHMETERLKANAGAPKLKMRVFFAESDVMIGKGGQHYFEKCWAREGVDACIDYKGEERPGTNHETVFVSADRSALTPIFDDLSNREEASEAQQSQDTAA